MENIVQEALQELFVAITARWRRENGVLAIGVPRKKLLELGEIKNEMLDDLIRKLKETVTPLGMELVEYIYEGESWYAIRSSYVCPSELKTEEEATMASIIASIESSVENQKKVPTGDLKKRLVGGKYLSEYQFDRILKQLEQLGYIQLKKNAIAYGARTLLEFTEESRKHLVEETKRLIF